MILLSNDLDFVGIIIIALILLFFLALLLWVLWIIFKTIFGGTVKFLFNSKTNTYTMNGGVYARRPARMGARPCSRGQTPKL